MPGIGRGARESGLFRRGERRRCRGSRLHPEPSLGKDFAAAWKIIQGQSQVHIQLLPVPRALQNPRLGYSRGGCTGKNPEVTAVDPTAPKIQLHPITGDIGKNKTCNFFSFKNENCHCPGGNRETLNQSLGRRMGWKPGFPV